MAVLTWSASLALSHARMDATHQDFIDCVNAVERALGEPALLDRLDALIEHCVDHFGQEDRWMVATGFTPENCHSAQHSQVLAVLREVRRLMAEEGRGDLVGPLLPELARWFESHAQGPDAGLAAHMRELGYDTETGSLAQAVTATMSGCGSERCAA